MVSFCSFLPMFPIFFCIFQHSRVVLFHPGIEKAWVKDKTLPKVYQTLELSAFAELAAETNQEQVKPNLWSNNYKVLPNCEKQMLCWCQTVFCPHPVVNVTNISSSNNINKFFVGIFNSKSHTNQVSTTGLGHSDIQLLTRPGNDRTESDRVLKYKITCPKTRLSLSSSSREPSQSSAWPLWRTDHYQVRAGGCPAEGRMENDINICITPSI